jgi:TetR/AcrR family transcriptional regulator, transcriptional repressor for nem operon
LAYLTKNKNMKANSREIIIQKTADLFNQKGPAATSLSDISEATGLTKGALYANFRDKNELAIAVFRYNIQRLSDKLNDILRLKECPHEKLLLALDFHENAYKFKEFRFGCPIANLATEADDTNPALKQEVIAAINKEVDFYQTLIQEAISKGIYGEAASADFARTLFACLEGALLLAKTTGVTIYLKEVTTYLRTTLEAWRKPAPNFA